MIETTTGQTILLQHLAPWKPMAARCVMAYRLNFNEDKMTPEQSFILSLLSPMKTFPMVLPWHLGSRIDRYRILRAQAGETLNTSDIVRQALTLFAYARPVGWPTAEMDGQGKAVNVKLPPVVIDYFEAAAGFHNQTKSDIARSAIVWFLNQMEVEQ